MAAFGYIFCLSLLMAVIAAFFDQILAYRKSDARDYLFCAFLSVLGFVVTSYFIPIVKEIMLRNNMWGYDINKNGRENDIKVYAKNRSNRRRVSLRPPLTISDDFLLQFCFTALYESSSN